MRGGALQQCLAEFFFFFFSFLKKIITNMVGRCFRRTQPQARARNFFELSFRFRWAKIAQR